VYRESNRPASQVFKAADETVLRHHILKRGDDDRDILEEDHQQCTHGLIVRSVSPLPKAFTQPIPNPLKRLALRIEETQTQLSMPLNRSNTRSCSLITTNALHSNAPSPSNRVPKNITYKKHLSPSSLCSLLPIQLNLSSPLCLLALGSCNAF